MNRLHDLKIVGKSNRYEIMLDGTKINGVTSAKFSAEVGEIPTLELKLFVGEYDIDVQTLDIDVEEKNDGK